MHRVDQRQAFANPTVLQTRLNLRRKLLMRRARGEPVDYEFSLDWMDSLDDESIDSSAPVDLAEPEDTVQ